MIAIGMINDSKIPSRAEVPDSDKWDLRHLFTEVSKWQEDFRAVEQTGRNINQWKGRVGESAQNLAEFSEFEKQLDLKIERLYHFASLQLAEDSANTEYLGRFGQLQNLMTQLGELSAFAVPEIQAIEDDTFTTFLRHAALTDWRTKFKKVRRMKPHVLSEPEERLMALGSVDLTGYDDAFLQLTDVVMKFVN